MRSFVVAAVVMVAAVVAGACGDVGSREDPSAAGGAAPPSTTTSTTAPTTTTSDTTPAPPLVVDVVYRLERRPTDAATADFELVVAETLGDSRGWSRAGYAFDRREEAPYLIVLAEGAEVDELCRPYDTYGKYSCQNGPVVAINADRWRSATPKWTGDLSDYRRMLVNHEVGHLLGLRHPKPQCPTPGEPAPVMNQQSTELDGCLANPWPLDAELVVAARHDRTFAPGYGE